MTPEDIKALAANGESETLEFRQSTNRLRAAARAVCAMLNQRGGRVLFGITPRGAVVGQQVSEKTVEDVAGTLRRITPRAYPSIDRVPLGNGREVIVVTVTPGDRKPHSFAGNATLRVGKTTTDMADEKYRQLVLEQMHPKDTWENRPAPDWSINDLDVPEIQRTVAEAIRLGRMPATASIEPGEALRGLQLSADGVLLRAATVLFGKASRLLPEMPQCYLRVARFRGNRLTDMSDNRQFLGNVFTLLEGAEQFLRDFVPVASKIENDRFVRTDTPRYPFTAVREAVANALCHRDYAAHGGSIGIAIHDDRLEVSSTGPFHFGLTPDRLLATPESRPWNPLIANALFCRGIVEQRGTGITRMEEETVSTGLPPPEIIDINGHVTVRFCAAPQHQHTQDPSSRRNAVLGLLERSPQGLPLREVCAALGMSPGNPRLRNDLRILRDNGMAEPVGHGRGARWRRNARP